MNLTRTQFRVKDDKINDARGRMVEEPHVPYAVTAKHPPSSKTATPAPSEPVSKVNASGFRSVLVKVLVGLVSGYSALVYQPV